MAARIARTGFLASSVALLGCGFLAAIGPPAALAAWSLDSTHLSEGRSYVIRQTLDTDHTIGVQWALTPDGVIRYSLDAGLEKVLAPTGSGAHPLYDPLCAVRGGSNYVAAYDAYDGRLKYFTDSGTFQDSVLAPTGDASGSGLVTRAFNGADGPVVASYSFADHQGRVLRFSRDGYLLSTYASDASSPGRWDWIFDVVSFSTGFMAYVYEGDGISGKSWIEYRAWDGHLVSIFHQRPEYSLPPYWFCSRSILCPLGKSYFYVLAPGTGPGLTDLVVSSNTGAVLHERFDLASAVAEPWLRLGEFGSSGYCIYGQYTDARRPGHAYMLDANGNFTTSYQQTPGPVDGVYHPRGILPSPDGSFVLSDTDNYRLNVYSSSASLLSATSLPGRPGALASLPDGSFLAVNLDQPSDTDLGGLLHISSTGVFLGTWGPWGVGPGDLAGPSDVAVGPDGNVYVADALNSRVQVFTAAGAPLRRWGHLGESPGGQFRPRAIAVTADRVFTLEDLPTGGSRVLTFTTTGAYVREWSTTAGLTDLEVTPALTIYGLAASGSAFTFDELGRALEVSASIPPATGPLLAPAAFSLTDDKLYVADTGNSRVVTFLQATPVARIVTVGPSLLPLARGLRVRILGDQLPSDLTAQIVPATGSAVIGSVAWLNPGEAVATFDLSAVQATSGDLWVSGTGLPSTNAATLALSAFVAPGLVGRWQRRTLDVSGNPDGPASEVLTVSPTGQVTWQRTDGTGLYRTGVLTAAGTQVSFCYTSALAPLGPETIAYTYALSGRSLTLTALSPFEDEGISYWSLVDGSNLLDPAVSGRWSLTALDEGAGPIPVTWSESMTIDLSGAFLHLSDRTGSALTSLGQIQAHDGQITRTESRATSDAIQISQTGSYDLTTGDLHIHFATPHVADEVWHRVAESGRRPLPWITVQLPPRLYRGIAATAIVTIGNHGTVNATQVVADLALPWLASPQRVATLTTLGPGEVKQYSIAITPAADTPLGPVVATATATVASPESSTARASATATLADPMLDLSVSMTFPTTTAPNVLVPVTVTLRSSGSDIAAAIPAAALNTVALSLTRSGALDVAGGDWTVTSTSLATIKWSAVLAALTGKSEVTWRIYLRSKTTVGALGGADLALLLPTGVVDASSEDNTAHGSLTIAAAVPNVAVNLQPLEGAKPGGLLTAFIRLASDPGETWKLRGLILEVDPVLDLYAATPSSGATLDPANSRVSWSTGGIDVGSDPGRNVAYTQVIPIPPSLPLGTTLTFRAVAYFDNMAPVVSADATLVVTGAVFGDANGDARVDSLDLILFIRAYRNARQGIYDPAFDLFPAEGVLPSLISHPDGVIDYRDAQLFLDAYLFHGN